MATVPGAPTLFSIAPGDGSIVLSYWLSSNGGSPVTDFEYQLGSDPVVSMGITRNPLEITGLTNGVSYNLKIRAINAIGTGPWSLTTSAIPEVNIYYTITRLGITSPDSNTARLVFNPATLPGTFLEFETFNFWRDEGYPQILSGPGDGVTSPSALTFDAPGLLTTNGLRWVTGNVLLEAPSGLWISFPFAGKVVAAFPTAPFNPTVVPGNTSLTVSWLAPASDGGTPITRYDAKLYIGPTLIDTYTDVTSPAVLSGLTNDTTYSIQLVAFNSVGETAAAPVSGTPFQPAVPTAPTIDSATAGDGTIGVVYTAPSSPGGAPITRYEYSLDGGTTFTSVGLVNPFQITGLTNGQLYTITLRAVNAGGNGPWSAPAYVMPASGNTIFATGDRLVRVVIDSSLSPPVHVSSTGTGDALNPRSWNVLQLYQDRSGGRVLTCMSVRYVNPWAYDLLLLQPLERQGTIFKDVDYGNVYLSNEAQAAGDLVFESSPPTVIYKNFNISIAAANATPNAKATARGLVVKDLANVSITPVGSLFGGDYSEFVSGTLVINAAGDYVSVSGEAMVRKLIMRRLLSRKGDFFHLPNYGAGMDIKSVFSTANLRTMAKDIEMQVLQEPEIEAARATLTYQAANSILIVQVQARMRNTGQQTSLSMSLPLSGSTQF